MLDWPAKMNTLSGLAKAVGERAQSSAAVRIAVGFMERLFVWIRLPGW